MPEIIQVWCLFFVFFFSKIFNFSGGELKADSAVECGFFAVERSDRSHYGAF
jgi:hypothetical protein